MHQAQRLAIWTAFDRHQRLTGKLQVDRGSGTLCWCTRGGIDYFRRCHADGQQLGVTYATIHRQALLVQSSPREHLFRVHSVLASNSRDRRSRFERRLDDPTLLLRRSPHPLPVIITRSNINRIAHDQSITQRKPHVHTARTARLRAYRGADSTRLPERAEAEYDRQGQASSAGLIQPILVGRLQPWQVTPCRFMQNLGESL